MRRIAIAVTLVEALMFFPEQALAYCRTTTCDRQDAPTNCTVPPGTCNTLGTPIAWPNTCVSTSVSAQGSVNSKITADQMRNVVQAAFQQWTSVNCGSGAPPNFVVDMFPDVNCTNMTEMTGDAGYKPTGPNYNLWIFHDSDWPYGIEAENAIALTTTQFNPTTGEIYDSDVELNSQESDFTTVLGSSAVMDLPSVVQHESGHFLGLAHTSVTTATMYATISDGETSKRTLDPDDKSAICAAYPPGKLNPNCDPEPRHGFSTECNFPNSSSSCAMTPGSSSGRTGAWGAILMGLLATAGARRRSIDRC